MPNILDIFWRFLLLGCTSFGGPAAHIGYFRRAFVEDRQWLDDEHFSRLIALTQFLPGPGSSQLGFGIGLHRAGVPGAIAAFLGFTLPSFAVMTAAAVSASWLLELSWMDGAIHGLKLLAVVVVADAVLGMYMNFCQRKTAALLMVMSAAALILLGGILLQICVLIVAAVIGMFRLMPDAVVPERSLAPNGMLLAVFGMAFAAAVALPSLASDFYLAGSLVFGGGHVVLPLLEELVAADLAGDQFLTGYALAQAVPGPMFTIASYLGALLWATSPVLGALTATAAIFLPGLVLMAAVQESWVRASSTGYLAGAAAGINAAVVGLLIAALYDPVIRSAVNDDLDVVLVLAGFTALRALRLNVAVVVVLMMAAGVLTTLV